MLVWPVPPTGQRRELGQIQFLRDIVFDWPYSIKDYVPVTVTHER
jgi:hypothetical protein